jgi:hypothetical protein
MYFLRGSLPW